MKSKKIKFILPAFALLLAVSFAFATEAITENRQGFISTPSGPMEVPGGVDCDSTTDDACLYLGQQVHGNIELSDPLQKSQ